MPGRHDQDGDHNLAMLDAAWSKAREHWDDDMSRHFDAHYWLPLRNESRAYLAALRNLLDLLCAAERDAPW